jgi:hypothetical protein
MAKEIRFTITERLDDILNSICGSLGIDKADYVRSLIINDLREKGVELPLDNNKNLPVSTPPRPTKTPTPINFTPKKQVTATNLPRTNPKIFSRR